MRARDPDVQNRARRPQRELPRGRGGGLDRPDSTHEPRVLAELDVRRGDEQRTVRHVRILWLDGFENEDRMARRFGEPFVIGGLEPDVEERPRDASQPVVLPQHRNCRLRLELARRQGAPACGRAEAPPTPPLVRSSPSSARRTERRASVRRRYARSRPASTRACRSYGRGPSGGTCGAPSRPSLASGRTSTFNPRRQRLLRYGFGAIGEVNAKHRDRPRGAVSALPGRDDPDQWASGGTLVIRTARNSPTASRSPMPNPIPSCGHSSSFPDPAVTVETGWDPFGGAERSCASR